MSPKILLRCSICQRYHASYLVEDPVFGKGYLCYDCWKARQSKQPAHKGAQDDSPRKDYSSAPDTDPSGGDSLPAQARAVE